MRAVLVHSPPHGEVPFRNLGLAYLQAVLERSGIEPVLFDISLKEDRDGTDFYDDYIRYLSQRVGDMGDGPDPRIIMEVTHPEQFDEVLPISATILVAAQRYFERLEPAGDVFLFTINTLTQYFACALAQRLRQAGKPTAFGGPNLQFEPLRRLLLSAGVADAVVLGEGEEIVADLVAWLAGDRAGTPPAGVSTLDAAGAVTARPPGRPPAVDELPAPSFRGTPINDFIPLLASRGCPRRCAFCSETSNWRSYRQREAAAVIDEMERSAERYRLTDFHFHDDTISGSLRWLDRFTAQLVKRRAGFTWESFCCPEGLDPARLGRMREAGCTLLKIGVQSFAPHVLKRMRRRPEQEALKTTLIEGSRAGIAIHYDMLLCFPGETDDDHRANLETIEAVFAACPEVYFSPNPFYLSLGSETMLHPERYGIDIRYFDPETLPPSAAAVVRSAGAFPVGFSYGLSAETVRRRMDDMGAVLARHGKDYLFLGRRAAPLPERH